MVLQVSMFVSLKIDFFSLQIYCNSTHKSGCAMNWNHAFQVGYFSPQYFESIQNFSNKAALSFFSQHSQRIKKWKIFFTEVCLCISQSIKHKMEYLPKIKCQHFSLGPVFPVQLQLHQVILQIILFRFRYLVWMSGTKHVALWSLMFQFCHLLDLQNGIHDTRSSGQGVWVPVISYLKQQICIFSGGHAGFSVSSFPPLPTPSPCCYTLPMSLTVPPKYKSAVKSGKSTTKNCLSTWKTANPLYILTKTKKSNIWRSHTYSRQILY